MEDFKDESKAFNQWGHVEIALSALLAAVCVIILVIGANRGSGLLVWIGGIGAALGILGQFWYTHVAITGILGRLDQMEK